MSRKQAAVTVKECVEDAVSGAWSEIEDLEGELQEWLDNMPENLHDSDKASQLGEAIDMLQYCSQPDVPADVVDTEVVYQVRTGRLSRPKRRDNAVAALRAALEAIEDVVEVDDVDTFKDEVEEAANEWENVEFPGMFG